MLEVSVGTIIWTSIAFIFVLFILGKFAWKPILQSIKEREDFIEEALQSAENARLEMAKLESKNESLLNEARAERDAMLKEAREIKDSIVAESKSKAKEEADKMVANARAVINNEKMAAITALKNEVATLSIQIAEKILKEQLSDSDKQKMLVNSLLEEVTLN